MGMYSDVCINMMFVCIPPSFLRLPLFGEIQSRRASILSMAPYFICVYV